MSEVFKRYPSGGGEMLLALALADVARDDGRLMINDSVDELARKTRQTRRGVQLQLRRMETMGWLHAVQASDGGRGLASVYRIDERWIDGGDLQAPPALTEEQQNRERGSQFAESKTANAATRNREPRSPSITTKKTRIQIPPSPPKGGEADGSRSSASPKRQRGRQLTLAAWLEERKAAGERALPGNDAVFAYAERVGLPRDFVVLCWHEFKARRIDGTKRQADWRATFRNAVRANWFRLWFIPADGVAELTTAGRQAQAAHATVEHDPTPPLGPSTPPCGAGNSAPALALAAGGGQW